MSRSEPRPKRRKERAKRVLEPSRSPSPPSPPPPTPVTRFANNTVMVKKLVDWAAFADFGLREKFENVGWTFFMDIDEPVYTSIVREFYENLAQVGLTEWTTRIGGVEIPINERAINRICVAPDDGLRVYCKKGWPTYEGFDARACMQRLTGQPEWNLLQRPESKFLTVAGKVVSHVLGYTVYPISGHRKTAGIFNYYVVDCLMTGTRLSLGYLIMQHMVHIQERANLPLPFGEVITRIVHLYRPRLLTGPQLKNHDRLNGHTLRAMKIFKINGEWVFQPDREDMPRRRVAHPGGPVDEVQAELDAGDDEAGGSGQPSAEPRWEFTQSHYDALNTRLDNLSLSFNARMDSLTETVTEMQESQRLFYDFMYAQYGHSGSQSIPDSQPPWSRMSRVLVFC